MDTVAYTTEKLGRNHEPQILNMSTTIQFFVNMKEFKKLES